MVIPVIILSLQAVRPLEAVIPLGCAPELARNIDHIAQLTGKGDYAGAKAALRTLPNASVRFKWDDSGVPKDLRFDYSQQREAVTREWRNWAVVEVAQVTTDPDFVVSFRPGSGVDLTWSDDPKQPRLKESIGITGAYPAAVHNAFSYGVASYYGIAKIPMSGLIMSKSGFETGQPLGISKFEGDAATANISVSDRIRAQVSKSLPVTAGLPKLAEDPAPFKFDSILQGTYIPVSIPIKNSGTGRLLFKVIPDCGCFQVAKNPAGVLPDKTGEAMAKMETLDFSGPVHHVLYLFTNDSTDPIRAIPVDVFVQPRYRFSPPDPHIVITDDTGAASVDAYIYTPPDHPFSVLSASSEGWPGDVTVEPWQGTLADPPLKEGPLPRKGYKLTLKLKDVPAGSQLGTSIVVNTDDPTFSTLKHPVFFQRGIVVLPPSVYLGEVGSSPRKVVFQVSRTGKPFKVLGLDSDSSHISASIADTPVAGELRVTVLYDGKAPAGDFHATVTIKTDDAKQPVIDVPVQGTVRK